jgi:hypothetical protein
MMYLSPMGDDPAVPATTTNLHDFINSDNVSTASMFALTYHGYKRSGGSLFWALVYGLAGRWVPVVAVPVAMAQGFGERKPCP